MRLRMILAKLVTGQGNMQQLYISKSDMYMYYAKVRSDKQISIRCVSFHVVVVVCISARLQLCSGTTFLPCLLQTFFLLILNALFFHLCWFQPCSCRSCHCALSKGAKLGDLSAACQHIYLLIIGSLFRLLAAGERM